MGLSHWDFFLELEEQFTTHTRNIGYSSAYYSVHSHALAEIIESACSTFSTTAALLCRTIDPSARTKTLEECRGTILAAYPSFTAFKVMVPSYNMALTPWETWSENTAPEWWTAYESLRADREKNLRAANYWNALYATAGVLVGILYYHKAVHPGVCTIEQMQSPKIFLPKRYGPPAPDWLGWCYTIPEELEAAG